MLCCYVISYKKPLSLASCSEKLWNWFIPKIKWLSREQHQLNKHKNLCSTNEQNRVHHDIVLQQSVRNMRDVFEWERN